MGIYVLLSQHTRLVLLIPALHLIQSADQPLHLLASVSDGQVSQNIANISKFNLYVVFIPKDIIYLNAGQADLQRMHRQLCGIKIINAVAVDQFPGKGIIAADFVDLFPGILCKLNYPAEGLLAPQRQISSGNIQAGQQQIGGAGGLTQIDDLAHIPLFHALSDQQQGALGQAAAGLVHADGRHVRPRFHG